ncbi:MAG: glycosyltransferase family 9 protein [Candidatus Eremiobacteraeota bacterium]|nr:glycosyltransferase family 9 protein [Candidatus Eremiobacteraeota bacterium]
MHTNADARALLVCAGGGLGDSLVASVVARALQRRYRFVDALTLPGHRETLERSPDVDRVYVDDGVPEAELAAALAARDYSAAIVTWATARIARILQSARIPIRVGQARRLYSWRFTRRVTVRSEIGDIASPWADILLDFARVLNCDCEDRAPRFVPTDADLARAAAFLDAFPQCARGFALVHATNAIATQREVWPVAGWIALVRAIQNRFDVPVILGGSAADVPIVETIARESQAISAAGKVDIGAYGALASRAEFFAGITTGSMHVAAAAGAPTVGIFPFQTDFPERWRPLGARTAIIRASYPCRPRERKETCPDYACVRHLDVHRILAAIESLRPVAARA